MKVRIKSREEIKKTKTTQDAAWFTAEMYKLCGTIMELDDNETTSKNIYRQTEPDGCIHWSWHKDWFDIIEEFEVGDIVEAFGVRGVVIYIDTGDYAMPNPIWIEFNKAFRVSFMPDGRLHDWHKEPSLKLISKAKKKETRYQFCYSPTCDLHKFYVTCSKFKDEEAFKRASDKVFSYFRIDESAEEFEV